MSNLIPRRTNLLMDLHETWSFKIECHDDADGTIVSDLVGASISIAIADISGNTVMEIPGIILNPASDGLALIMVTPDQQTSASIEAGRFSYTIRVIRADGTVSDQAFGSLMIRETEYN